MKHITSIGEILFDIYQGRKSLGGAPFNFIYHIIKLTGNGSFISRIGRDTAGKEILDFLSVNAIPNKFIQIDPVYPTGESIAKLNKRKIPSWEIKTDSAYDFIELNDEIDHLVTKKTDCLYFGTLAQRNIKSRHSIHYFFGRDIKYFCDLNIRQNFYTKELLRDCLLTSDVLKLNIEELHLVNDLLLDKSFDKKETPIRLLNEYGISLLCVTHGEEGASIYMGERDSYYKLQIENVVDTVGAGDAYAAILCIGYVNEWDIDKTNRIASEFAGEIVKINGALPSGELLYNKYRQRVNE